MLVANKLIAMGDFLEDKMMDIEVEVKDIDGVLHPVNTKDILDGGSTGAYNRLSVLDCFVEGEYDYCGDPVEPLNSEFNNLVNDTLFDIPFTVTPYNWCMFAKIYPVVDLMANPDRLAAIENVEDGWSPVNEGVCKQFLEDPLHSGKAKHEQYANLDKLYDYYSWKFYDTVTTIPDLMTWYNAQNTSKVETEDEDEDEDEDSGTPSGPAVSSCSLLGAFPIGSTTKDCCDYLNSAAPVLIGGGSAADYSVEMTCFSDGNPGCYDASMAAVTLAAGMLGADFIGQFVGGCALLPPPPSPAPTSVDNVEETCYPFNNQDGTVDTTRDVGVCLRSCCDDIKNGVYDFGYTFDGATSLICGDVPGEKGDNCLASAHKYIETVDSVNADSLKASFDLTCKALFATERKPAGPCNPANNDHTSCWNPYFHQGYAILEECSASVEDFIIDSDALHNCARYEKFVDATQRNIDGGWDSLGYNIGSGVIRKSDCRVGDQYQKFNDCFHDMTLFALAAFKWIKLGDDFWQPEHADFNIKTMHSEGVRWLPFSGTCTGVDDKAGRGVSIVANLGCGGSCNSTADNVYALQTIYFQATAMTLVNQWKDMYGWILSPDDVKDALTAWKKIVVDQVYGETSYINSDGEKAVIFTAGFVQEAFSWAISKASEGSFGLVVVGYLLMITYAKMSFMRCRSFFHKSRFILGLFGVLTVALGIGSGLGVASMLGIKFNATSIQVLPFLLLGLGVDDMFIVAGSFHTFDKNVADAEEVAGNCLAVTGPSILLTSVTNTIAFGFGMLTPLPVCIAFTQMAACCVVFIFMNVLFVFTAVCSVDAKRRRRGQPDPLFFCFGKKDFEALKESGAEEQGSALSRLYGKFIVSWIGRLLIIGGVAAFIVFGTEQGWKKLKQGLSFEHIFQEGSHEADFWVIQDGFFGFMPFAIATRKLDDWPKQHPLYFRLQTSVEADDCKDDICLCGSSKNPLACEGFYGNNGIHEKAAVDGVDLGISIPFPGSIENECRLSYENWVKCIKTEYTYVNSHEGQPWIREKYAKQGLPGFSDEVPELSDLPDRCGVPRDEAFKTCKKGWLDFDSMTRGVYALWKNETHPVPPERVFTTAEVKDYYANFPYEYPTLSQSEVPQTWIQPYDDLVSELGLNWLHMMYQWGLPCWYGLPWVQLGGRPGYPIQPNIPDLKTQCATGFGSEAAYNVRCEDGNFGEAKDTENDGKCGSAWGQTWGKHLKREPIEYVGTSQVAKGGSCCSNSDCKDCDYISVDPDTGKWKHLDDSERNTQFRRGELSATMDILVEYVFQPLGMEVTYDAETGRALYVVDPRLDTFDDESGRSGNFSLSTITSILQPRGEEISGPDDADQEILNNKWFGTCPIIDPDSDEYIEDAHCPGSNPDVDEDGNPKLDEFGQPKRKDYCSCHSHSGGEAFLSRCSAWPVAYMMCNVEGDGWAKTGMEPCWKGQEWLDTYNSAFFKLAFHPHHFEECLKLWVDNDDYWKLLGPGFQCECSKDMEEKDLSKSGLTFSIPEGTCELGPKDDTNPTGYHTDCSLIPQGYRKLIYPMPITMMQMFANRLTSTEKYVELIKWSRDTISKYEEKTGFAAFPTGIPIIFWEQYTTLWDTVSQVVILMGFVVYGIMALTFLFIQPSGVGVVMKFLTAMWTSLILTVCIMLITFSLVCLMGFADIWLNGIPAVTLIVSVGVAVEFTAHLCFAYLQSTGTAVDRTKHAVDHMFKPLVDGAISTFLGIAMLATTEFIFVEKYFFLLYFVLTMGGLVIGLVLLPCLLGLIGLPANVSGGGDADTSVSLKTVVPT